ncbi:MAG: HAMP domain-containing histidine kinase [Synechococcales cyanobacterium CRU_2_2]|nr:HAMP domain-containing histidine kinase [Synechococcales cyanobacterium CRU_2_2]
MVQDLLDLNQLQAHSAAHLTLKTIDLTRLIQSAWIGLEPLAREQQIQLDYVGPECLLVQADEARLHRVLLNLLDNSIKYSPAQQCIRIQVSLAPAEDGYLTNKCIWR